VSFLDLSRVVQRTFSDQAADRLREAIRSGSLPPGSRLVERAIADRLGMSRIPVREAVQQLLDQGLVKKIPHRGTFVYAPERDEIEEISSLRCVLEGFVVERVMERWLPEHEASLLQVVEEMRRHAVALDFQQLYEQDLAFHHLLWRIADHHLLLEVVSGLRSRINRFLSEAAGAMPPSQLEAYIASHTDLISALASGDVPRAQRNITAHIMRSKDRNLAYHADQQKGTILAGRATGVEEPSSLPRGANAGQ
jgi:DNA-binding GntR family transcriptional regulator